MTQTIALAGKGGVGKTTVCGLLIQYLCAKDQGPVLAVDADANSNLNEVLGVEVEMTLGDIREDVARSDIADPSPVPVGMTKQEFAEMKFADALVEGDDFDMLVMGRTQGRGCYRYVVVDNEAGMEHISRGILPKVDTVILVSDCSRRGVQAAARIFELTKSLDIGAKEIKLIINRAPGGVASEGVLEEVRKAGMDLLCVLPHDDTIYEYDSDGIPTVNLPEEDPFKKTLYAALDKLNF